MSATNGGIRIIDADGHVIEPRGMWEEYIEDAFKERAPRSRGPFSVILNGQVHPRQEGPNSARQSDAGLGEAHKDAYVDKFVEARQDRFSVEAYLRDMDREGIDTAVLFPTQGLFAVSSDEL